MDDPNQETIARETLRAGLTSLVAASAAMAGPYLFLQLQQEDSRLRLWLAETSERTRIGLREWWIRRTVNRLTGEE